MLASSLLLAVVIGLSWSEFAQILNEAPVTATGSYLRLSLAASVFLSAISLALLDDGPIAAALIVGIGYSLAQVVQVLGIDRTHQLFLASGCFLVALQLHWVV